MMPCFIDQAARPCALAFLLQRTGQAELASQIAKESNFSFVNEMRTRLEPRSWLALRQWLERDAKLSVVEAAAVQPTYSAYGERVLEHVENVEADVVVGWFDRWRAEREARLAGAPPIEQVDARRRWAELCAEDRTTKECRTAKKVAQRHKAMTFAARHDHKARRDKGDRYHYDEPVGWMVAPDGTTAEQAEALLVDGGPNSCAAVVRRLPHDDADAMERENDAAFPCEFEDSTRFYGGDWHRPDHNNLDSKTVYRLARAAPFEVVALVRDGQVRRFRLVGFWKKLQWTVVNGFGRRVSDDDLRGRPVEEHFYMRVIELPLDGETQKPRDKWPEARHSVHRVGDMPCVDSSIKECFDYIVNYTLTYNY